MANINKKFSVEKENINFDLGSYKQKIVGSIIKWNDKTNSLMYYILEPEISEKEKTIIWNIKKILQKYKHKNIENIGEIIRIYSSLKKKMRFNTTLVQDTIIEYYVYRDIFGYGKLEGLVWDPNIKFMAFDKIGIPIMVFHKEYGFMPTNVIISTPEELLSTIFLLKSRSLYKHEDKSAFIGKNAANEIIFVNKDVDSFTVKKPEESFFNPITLLMKTGLANIEMFSFIEFFLKNKSSILVIGPKFADKANFISGLGSILDDSKIITFENYPQININSNKWISELIPAHYYAENSIIDNLLRHTQNYIISSGIRGTALKKIVSVLPKSSGIISIDADSVKDGLRVLLSNPVNLDKSALTNFDLIILLTVEKHGAHYLQRIKEVVEIVDYSPESDKLKLNTVFRWNSKTDKVVPLKSVLLEKLEKKTNKSPKRLIEELKLSVKSAKSLVD